MSASPKSTPSASSSDKPPSSGTPLVDTYLDVRRFSDKLCRPLETEDHVVQTMADVSPTKWHLAHTSWFFETFLLIPYLRGYESPNPRYNFLFNSYYNAVGAQHYRPHRGFVTRPTVAEVIAYRKHVDEHMARLMAGPDFTDDMAAIVEIGINHEQQHQELILTDIKHVLSCNPLGPSYHRTSPPERSGARSEAWRWIPFEEGIRWIGYEGEGFSYDNEGPRHRVFLESFQLASRLVTVGEYLEFMRDNGYGRPELWLSEGWATVQERGWKAPLYWEQQDGRWIMFSLWGMREIDENEPVAHVSYYEADAYARWAGYRLPTETEWETGAEGVRIEGNLADGGRFHPAPSAPGGDVPQQMYGDVWEWTSSSYAPYPGYRPAEGAIGEYNGKFMCNQYVLRGGSCATSQSHVRATYRNFFPADARWQFSGIRLARSGK